MIKTDLTCPAIRLVPPAPPKPLEFLFRNGCQGDQSRPGGQFHLPVTRKRLNENSRELPSSLEEVPGEVGEQGFDCVCGRLFQL